ncbi:VOC family protein [Bacillus mesophilum]|uniref:VOC family protein n=1 Tax=Bacillus mesophilum TaxID=1071718 RepID=A0A7V7RHH3_9BACI|nr:VOC family protein [Bacillus mesophilum]KAB2328725.1 VOC family protein [Bacillus mesophilum]
MFFEITIQFRVTNFQEGYKWYKTFLNKEADFVPHEGFAEWEVIPGCWLQIAEGIPSEGSGPLRLGVKKIYAEKIRLKEQLDVADFEIYSREEVPVKWGTLTDPWGNHIGLFEYINKNEEDERIKAIIRI